MKKFVCMLLVLVMFCSVMMVHSAAATTYDGKGFEFVTDEEVEYSSYTDEWDDGTTYSYFFSFDGLGDIEIFVESIDSNMLEMYEVDSCEELYEAYKAEIEGEDEFEVKEILFCGVPAFVSYFEDFGSVNFWSNNYFYYIEIEANDEDSRDMLYDIAKDSFRITDSITWCESDDADKDIDKSDRDSKTEDKTEDETEDESKEVRESDDTTIIIVAIIVAGVVILGVVAIVVLGKKKK